jgi:3-oxoacyl-[acyl-carrier-protein] synthase II
MRSVVITGIGMVTPLGRSPDTILDRLYSNETVVTKPAFETAKFDCPLCAPITDFDAESLFPENKTLRFMNRDAQMAVIAARHAMDDADVRADETYPAENIALYGSTGVTGMSVEEITRIIKYAAGDDGSLSLERFGKMALRRVRPVLSFRILANMPICFVSIFENIRGPNAVYTPWEGHGAQAIAAGIRAIKRGDVPCALVGGCDVKTRELSFINLQQLGIFESWKRYGKRCIPGEGAAFIVLEHEGKAVKRGKTAYARINDYKTGSLSNKSGLKDTFQSVISELNINNCLAAVIAGGDGDVTIAESEQQAFEVVGLRPKILLKPKFQIGNLFAAAASIQIGLAAALAGRGKNRHQFIANCFGHGSEQASFLLEAV